MTGTPVIAQDSFAFYNDGTESGATIIGSVNGNPTLGVTTTYGCRFLVKNTGTGAQSNMDLEFQYNLNSAGWNNITTTSSVIIAVDSANLTNAADCTQRIGVGTFHTNNDGVTEDGISGGNNLDLAAGAETETLLAFQIVAADVVDTDTIQIRLTRDGGTLLGTYTVTPTITVNEAAGPSTINCTAGVVDSAGVNATITPGAVTITCSAGVVDSAGLTATISNASVINCSAGVIDSAGVSASVTPGAVTITCAAGIVDSAGQTADVTPGAVVITCTADVLASAGHMASVGNIVVVTCSAGVIDSAGVSASVIPGAVTITCSAGVVDSAGINATITPGAVTITCTADVLASVGYSAIVSTTGGGPVVICTAGVVDSAGLTATLVPGAVVITCTADVLASAGLDAIITSVSDVSGVVTGGGGEARADEPFAAAVVEERSGGQDHIV